MMESSARDHAQRVESSARRVETPCGGARMVWRIWGTSEPLLLLHGGHGSWMHWMRNVRELAGRHAVIVPDLPGLGESDLPADPYSAEGVSAPVVAGLREILGPATAFDVAGFSFGGSVAGEVARSMREQVRWLVLVGSGGLDVPRPPMGEMRAWRHLPQDQRQAAHRHNLGVLMLHDSASIDELALHVQTESASRARINSRAISFSGSLQRALPSLRARIAGIWGEHDATSGSLLAERRKALREVQPASPFVTIAGAGHWVQYEAAEEFNAALEAMLRSG